MKSIVILICLIIIIQFACFGQDTLVRFQDLTFKSELEKKILEDYFLNKKRDYFMLSMANGTLLNESGVTNAKKRFYDHVRLIQTDKFNTKKIDKKVKQVYDDIHQTYLTKYELKNRFEDIFNNGYYNCVSASLLYGLAFQELGIPFQIVEKPSHVYLIAYPDRESIVVETTTPMGGFFNISDQFKSNYIKVLKDQKLISAQEFNTIDVHTLFDKYYFGEKKNVTIDQLAGIQYMNEGLYNMDEDKHLDAMHQFEKAYLFYPSERLGYLLMLSAFNSFSERETKDEVHALCLAKLSRYKKYGIKGDMVQGDFARVIQDLLFEQGAKEKLDSYYKVLTENLLDENLKNDISFLYNYENGRILYNRSKFKDGLTYLDKVLTLKPHHQDGNNLFISCLIQSLKNIRQDEVINIMEDYSSRHLFLKENNMFNEILGSSYLTEFDRSYRENNANNGERFRLLFENFRKAHKDVTIDDRLLANAYSSAAVYYFRKGQNTKAKSILSAGLEISPDNYELKMRKKSFD